MRYSRLLLGILAGLVIGSPLVLASNASASSRCHKQYCTATFRLKPHQRRIWTPRTKIRDGDRVYLRVVIKGKLIAPRYVGGCAAEFNAFGAAVMADGCMHNRAIQFTLTNTMPKAVKVKVSYAYLDPDIAN